MIRQVFLAVSLLMLGSTNSWAAQLNVARTNGEVDVLDAGGNGLRETWPLIGSENAVGTEFLNGQIYVSGGNFQAVVRANPDGSDQVTLPSTVGINNGGTAPSGERLDFALDSAGGRIFYTTGNGSDVVFGNLDGTGAATVLFEDVGGPTNGIEYNPLNDQIYYVDLSSGIYAANADGTGDPTLLFGGNGFRHLALDPAEARIYWTDFNDGLILSGSIGGGTATTLFSGLSNPYGIDLVASTGKLFWTEIGGNVYSGQTDGIGQTILYNGLGAIRGIAFSSVPEPSNIFGLILVTLGFGSIIKRKI